MEFAFSYRCSDIDFGWILHFGIGLNQKWHLEQIIQGVYALIDNEDIFKEDRDARERARKSVSSLRTSALATRAGEQYKRVRTYLVEDRIPSVTRYTFENMFPFQWTCTWNKSVFYEVAVGAMEYIGLLMKSKSSILRSSRMLVVAGLLEVIGSNEDVVTDMEWWGEEENQENVTQDIIDLWRLYHGKQATTDKIKEEVDATVQLFCKGVRILSQYRNVNSLLDYEKIPDFIYKREVDRRNGKGDAKHYMFMHTEEQKNVVKWVGYLDPYLEANWACHVSVLQKYFDTGKTRTKDIIVGSGRDVGYDFEPECEETFARSFFFLSDISWMIRDIMEVHKLLKTRRGGLMTFAERLQDFCEDGEREESAYAIDPVHLFAVTQALYKRVKIKRTDEEFQRLCEHVYDRVEADGTLTKERKRFPISVIRRAKKMRARIRKRRATESSTRVGNKRTRYLKETGVESEKSRSESPSDGSSSK